MLGYQRDGRLHVYWCMPDKEITNGLVPVDSGECIADMIKASQTHRTLVLYVDHTNFLRELRDDVIINGGPKLPPVISPRKIPPTARSVEFGSEQRVSDESDSDCDFYDSDCDAEDGDDDLFAENVDTEVFDHNEKEMQDEHEDEQALEDDDLNLVGEERDRLKHKLRAFNPEVDMDNPIFRVGMVFSGVEEARKALAAYHVRNRVKIRKTKNDRRRLEAICDEGCPWMFKASNDSRYGGFTITAYEGHHTCEGVWEMRSLTAKLLTDKFLHEFQDNQKLDLQGFAAKVTREFNMCPDRWKLSRARKAALLQIHGDEVAQFRQLLDYGQELRRSNPGSKFFLSTNSVLDPVSGEQKEHLASVYWSYDACKRGFLSGCRPLICIDGCHIKTKYKGILLTAVGIDPNDCIYPVAFGLVEVECKSSWEWFLSNLKDDLNITNTSPWTVMSDKQKGLINAVQKIWPDAEHRFCVRHMIQNFQKAGYKGETLKNDLWAIARSTNVPKWGKNMEKLKTDSEEAYNWIEQLNPNTWVKAFFSEFPKCDMLLNNHSEVFNSYILEARELPFLSMLETMFYKILQRGVGKQKEVDKWQGRICPKIKKKLEKFTEWSKQCSVQPSSNYVYSVRSLEMERTYTVDFKTKTCDCKRWQLSGIPCHHAIACCRHDRINPESLVHSCYSIDTYMKAYRHTLVPLRGRVFWEKMNGPVIQPPLYTKVMGRPKKNRKKAPEEKKKKGVTIFTKSGVTMHCSLCGKPDHNKKGHQKFVQNQVQQQHREIHGEDEERDIPYILQHVVPHIPDPTMDPMHQVDSMVYNLGQEARENVPVDRVLGPLPESAFIAAARENIPESRARVTTASNRGSLRGRGRGRSTATREPSRTQATGSRGRGKGKKRPAYARTSATEQDHEVEATERARAEKRGYDTGPGSAHYLLFGDAQRAATSTQIPDLNADVQEVAVSQNAPYDDI